MNLTVQIRGNDEEIARFKKLGDKLTDFSGAMNQVSKELKVFYGEAVINSEGSAISSKWRALSPVYKSWKGKHYPGQRMGILTGSMQKNFVGVSDKNSATITNRKNYFPYFQKLRPIFGVNSNVEKIVTNIIETDVDKKLAAS